METETSKVVGVVLAEDHETVRQAIKMVLDAQPDIDVIGEAGNGDEAINMANKLKPDVLLMDIAMPETNGISATRIIKRSNPEIKIVALTRHDEEGYLRQMMDAGASGFVLKQSPPAALIKAVRQAALGKIYLDAAMTTKVIDSLSAAPSNGGDQNKNELTPRQAEILRLNALGNSNKEVSEHLQISIKLTEMEKSLALKKLNLSDRVALMRYAISQGWLQDG